MFMVFVCVYWQVDQWFKMTLPPEDTQLYCKYDPKRRDLVEGVSKCMISGQEAQAKFSEYHEAQGSHRRPQNKQESGGNGGHQPPFPDRWDNLPPTVQKTFRQQHHLCSWGYSHQSGTELLPTYGPSPPRCSGRVCRQMRVKTLRTLLFAISCTSSGWVTRAPIFGSAGYQATVALKEIKRASGPTSKRDHDIDPVASVHYTDVKPLVNSYIQKLVQTKWSYMAEMSTLWNQHWSNKINSSTESELKRL